MISQPKTKTNRAWTPERRAAQAEAIRRWAPWKSSTGPRTAAGKARSAQNAAKPWLRLDPDRRLESALRVQRRYITEIKRYSDAKNLFPKNKLLKNRRRALLKLGRKATVQLHAALVYAKLCKNLAFSPPFPLKVNANDDDKT